MGKNKFLITCLVRVMALAGGVIGSNSHAFAVASIYDGAQYEMENQLLVQDSENPGNFYVVPQKYRLKRSNGKPLITHEVMPKDDPKYSVYTMTLILDEPDIREKLIAATMLRQKAGIDAVIQGTAPVCGIRIGIPGFDKVTQSASAGAQEAKGEFLQYSISSTDAGKCGTFLKTSEFKVTYRVPINMEPSIAKQLTSKVGIVLPSVELILPTKYTDSVELTFDANSSIEQLKGSVGFTGTIKAVTAEVNHSVEKMVNRLRMNGGIRRKCQNPDKSICDRFETNAAQMLSQMVLQYLPLGSAGETNPLVLADKDKSMPASAFKVQLATDYQSAIRDGKFHIDFSNVVYDTLGAQVQIEAKKVPKDILDPFIRKMME